MSDLVCSYCMVERQELVPAVTLYKGFAVCVSCNFECHEAHEASMADIAAITKAAARR